MSFIPSSNPVVLGLPQADYHAFGKDIKRGDPAFVMSRSQLQRFAECPSKWHRGSAEDESSAMRFGSLVDCLVTTPDAFEHIYAIQPRSYTTTGMECPMCKSVTDSAKCSKCKCARVETTVSKPWSNQSDTCRQWIAEQAAAGLAVVDEAGLTEAYKAKRRLLDDEEIGAILAASETQVQINVEWHDERTGLVIPVKCMIDIMPGPESPFGDTLFDLKVVADANPLKWDRYVHSYGLHYQGAAYLDAVNAATGLKYENFGNVIVESTEPFEPAVQRLSQEFIEEGRKCYQADLRLYCWCLKNNEWPGYHRGVVGPTPWMLRA